MMGNHHLPPSLLRDLRAALFLTVACAGCHLMCTAQGYDAGTDSVHLSINDLSGREIAIQALARAEGNFQMLRSIERRLFHKRTAPDALQAFRDWGRATSLHGAITPLAKNVNWCRHFDSIDFPEKFHNGTEVAKQQLNHLVQSAYGYQHWVETGTFVGITLEAMVDRFADIESVELDPALYLNAVEKLSKHKNVRLHLGDSKAVISDIVQGITRPTQFWLDGHYSYGITAMSEGEQSPILAELHTILSHPLSSTFAILIDDIRTFGGFDNCVQTQNECYPTLKELLAFVCEKQPLLEPYFVRSVNTDPGSDSDEIRDLDVLMLLPRVH